MKHTWIITCFLILMFFASQVIGLYVTYKYLNVPASEEEGKPVWNDLPLISRPDIEPQFSIAYIIGAVIIGTLLILLMIRFNAVLLWKLWFYFAVVTCLTIAVFAFLQFLPRNYAIPIAIIIALVFGFFKVFRPNLYLHNLTELFVYSGLAVIFVPMLNVMYAFILMIALSFYDMYAVWKSKHMIKMAKFQTKSGIFAGFLIPYTAPSLRGVKKKVRTAVLGGGDIGFPLIFAGTVLVASGFIPALIVSVCTTASLSILLLLSQKDRFYPAIPFLTAGCAVGYLIVRLLQYIIPL